ncbi:hypothetical protein QTP70_016823 [Hemibagrus guttatus]|uniref:C2H2-type domain-containing protein n=1 Tax=Hemibagrus guttatus TaxID=175788 RepID=A0AAE0QXF5_9TELE|nr:hypothetical protein QTP70_016823 [Hemibagrus guttatus]
MMMHRMSPLMASEDSSGDISLTPPSPAKTKKQHKSPETWPKKELSQDSDNTSDGKESTTEQADGHRRTYSYMSPISSDEDDFPENPQRRNHAKHGKRQSMKSSLQEKPKRKGSIKKTQNCSDLSPAKSESDDYIHSEVSLKKRGQARKETMKSPKGSDQEARNGVTGKAKARKRQNKHANSNVSTDSDSETFSDKLTKNATTSRKSQGKCRVSTEMVEPVEHSTSDLDSSRARSCSMSEDEDAKNSAEYQAKNSAEKFQRRIKHRHSDSASSDTEEDMEEKPKMHGVKVTQKRKYQALKTLLGKSDMVERPIEGSLSKPRVKKKESPRKSVPIECEICGRSIRCKAILERHMLSHTGEKPFECDECGKHYTSSSNLRIHQLSHSGKMDYVCNECGQKFTHLPYLKRHLLRHSGKKMHICEHCGKGFIQKYHLLRHILVHTRQMPHVCDKCGMSFNRTDYLNLHLRNVHLIESNTPKAKVEKLYKCETCNKSFANHSSLETHKRIHTGAMPYSCIVCSRQFKQSSHLYSHMFTHSSEKPHACNLCELKFTRKSYLRKHKERVHTGAEEAQSS